jgi:nitric oxide dioxygenase
VTPQQIALIEATIDGLESRLESVAGDFYERLFATAPETRALFTGDLDQQRVVFASELRATLLLVRDHTAFLEQTTRLGRRHRSYGVRPVHVRIARDHLMGALAAGMGDAWTPAVADAWITAYNLVTEAMLAAAFQASSR